MPLLQWLAPLQRHHPPGPESVNLVSPVEPVAEVGAATGQPWPRLTWTWKLPKWEGVKLPVWGKKKGVETIRKERVGVLAEAVKAENLADLNDILGALILSECVYKRPEAEMLRAMNRFKADFGGDLVTLERVQVSLDHVHHRYLLAETGDALFASFMGTKQYRDLLADANVVQESLFHGEDELDAGDEEEHQSGRSQALLGTETGPLPVVPPMAKERPRGNGRPQPAAHRGFLTRARAIPALELYRLAQRKQRRLVLCGHSLGGAVAVITTLAILRALSVASKARNEPVGRVPVKCITFAQPPVGNAALRDYVQRRGWQRYFRSFCIPEDIVPRILSPQYFHHYSLQAEAGPPISSTTPFIVAPESPPRFGPFWRVPRLVPLASPKALAFQNWVAAKRKRLGESMIRRARPEGRSSQEIPPLGRTVAELAESVVETNTQNGRTQEEGVNGTLKEGGASGILEGAVLNGSLQEEVVNGTPKDSPPGWAEQVLKRVPPGMPSMAVPVPSVPSYVPFGQLLLLTAGAAEPVRASDWQKLLSAASGLRGWLTELQARFRNHTMASYRARFHNMYALSMSDGIPFTAALLTPPAPPSPLPWFAAPGGPQISPAKLAEPLVVLTATSVVPLNWDGKKHSDIRVDIQGRNLHACNHIRAKVSGVYCRVVIEAEASPPPDPWEEDLPLGVPKGLEKMRVRIGRPLRRSGGPQGTGGAEGGAEGGEEELREGETENGEESVSGWSEELKGEVVLECCNDFEMVPKEVAMRLRKVRLLGLEGAGKTTLFSALLSEGTPPGGERFEAGVTPDTDWREGVSGGVGYIDAAGVNLQDLESDASALRAELAADAGPLGRRVDLVLLVHNAASKVPRLRKAGPWGEPDDRPALSVLLNEVHCAGIPILLAVTNKFAASADRRPQVTSAVSQAYSIPPEATATVNSLPYVLQTFTPTGPALPPPESSGGEVEAGGGLRSLPGGALRLVAAAPRSLAQTAMLPFKRRETVLPVEGVKEVRTMVHSVLEKNEEAALEEVARVALLRQTAVEASREAAAVALKGKLNPTAAIGAALGAGVGVFGALLFGANRRGGY